MTEVVPLCANLVQGHARLCAGFLNDLQQEINITIANGMDSGVTASILDVLVKHVVVFTSRLIGTTRSGLAAFRSHGQAGAAAAGGLRAAGAAIPEEVVAQAF